MMSDSQEFLLVNYMFWPVLGTHARPSLLTSNIPGSQVEGEEGQDFKVSLSCPQGTVSLGSMDQTVFRGFAQLYSPQ